MSHLAHGLDFYARVAAANALLLAARVWYGLKELAEPFNRDATVSGKRQSGTSVRGVD